MPKESEKTANTYEKPAQTRVENISSSAIQTDTAPDNSASEGEETRRTGRRAARRKAMEALHEDHDHKPEI